MSGNYRRYKLLISCLIVCSILGWVVMLIMNVTFSMSESQPIDFYPRLWKLIGDVAVSPSDLQAAAMHQSDIRLNGITKSSLQVRRCLGVLLSVSVVAGPP